MLTLQQLQVFCAVAEHLHFTRAADALNLSQPAVTFHIRSLERYLGVQLFEVRGHQVFLTDAGDFLWQRAMEVLNGAQSIERSMREFAEAQDGLLRLGTTHTIASYVLPHILTRFHYGYPRLRLSLEVASTARIEQALLTRELGLALVGWRVTSPEIVVVPFQTDELVVAVPIGHPFSYEKEVKVEQVVEERFVLREQGSAMRELATDALGPFAEQIKVVLEMNSTEAIKRAVQAGMGITVLSHVIIKSEIERGEIAAVRVVGHRMERSFSIAYPRGRPLSPAANAFVSFLLQDRSLHLAKS